MRHVQQFSEDFKTHTTAKIARLATMKALFGMKEKTVRHATFKPAPKIISKLLSAHAGVHTDSYFGNVSA